MPFNHTSSSLARPYDMETDPFWKARCDGQFGSRSPIGHLA